MTRVLNVIHYPVFGGPHNQALRLSGPLASRGYDTVVVVPDEPGNAASRLRAGGVDVCPLLLHRLRATRDLRVHLGLAFGFLGDVARLREFIRTQAIDIVQIGGLVNPQAAMAARLEHVPVVWQLLDTRAPTPIAMVAMVWVRELADVVMSTGDAVAKSHPGYPAIADRVAPFFPPVDLARFRPPHPQLRAKVRASWGIPADALVVGCVANINAQKGIIELVRAFATVRLEHPSARLVLVGAEYPDHADYSAAVRDAMAVHNLVEGRDAIFVGERDDVERQLAGMDVIALAAVPRSEGITTAVLEAMAAGLPVVVTDVGALREAVENTRTGFVVAPGDTAALASALAHLLDDPVLRASVGRAARKSAEDRFGIDACADSHARAYEQALAGHRKARSRPIL